MGKFLRFSMLFIYSILAFGAIVSGGMLIQDSSGKSMGLSIDLLNHSPFQNYLVPGILLYSVIGFSQALSAYKLIKGGKYTKEILIFAGLAILIWITVQLILIGYVFFLQAIILFVSVVELLFAAKFKSNS